MQESLSWWKQFQHDLVDPQHVESLLVGVGVDLIRVIVLYIIARIVIRLALKLTRRLLRLHSRMDKRRLDTLDSLFGNIIRYTVFFLFIVESLAVFHLNIATLLAGAGVVGLAVGFGAQGLIKDLITGLFILFEDQYGVGDTVQINGFTGTVMSIGVRLTRVQAWTGEIEIIPNGQIATVTNYSRTNSLAVIEVGIAYGANLGQAMKIIEDVLARLKREEADIVGDVSMSGVQELRESDVLIRATAVCAPTKQAGIQRKAQQRIKEAFDEAGIEIPFAHRTVVLKGDVSALNGGNHHAG
ncbi:mechanosensitive ion channel family protein [Alicyclobacillus fastidiosus]|uniref:Mechanosensitive ion channel family protein n=1 Tax=Alicyclobacillus fastidiosus TaxID=392011 RepID=A0ABY6ZIA5_9BACL|nr:mechanosensitive ion channel family protein [Alicyclobacillus fastidiosus]WAH41946.1 mechanosensitive ion channel family protein [Alicyclobacillus fastidiosus]GMA63670.1 mechanosensitive ion channel protein MscS [Alicyclobacillus fastidiosus]